MADGRGSSGYKYGSVDNNDEEAGVDEKDKSFDESNLYFYKEEDLTRQEKISKFVKLFVPIILAVSMVGGLAYILFHDFGDLYPGPGEKSHSAGRVSQPTTVTSDDYTPNIANMSSSSNSSHGSSIPVISQTKTSSGNSCEANPGCAALGLTGNCCPTSEGIKLGCCH
ncbi:unnamed protein product [Pseudo-nitzschia multistriata]|uniref:Uncharacterized protein n=1 Tax=Pseudo-nitzschia multistriata TaxID=183589 RepID=A0A448Z482_9STRA|nr:unnamed protein product [Pseudo-nitzschia multistriata]